MRPRTKIITTILAMILVVGAMVVGMFATANHSVTVGNTLIFNPQKGVGATVYVRVEGHDPNYSTVAKSNIWESDKITFKPDDEVHVEDLLLGTLHWKDKDIPIYLYLVITNNTASQKLVINLDGFSQPANPSLAYTYKEGMGEASGEFVKNTNEFKGIMLNNLITPTPTGVAANAGPDGGGLRNGKTYVLEIAYNLTNVGSDITQDNNYAIALNSEPI